MNHSLLLPLAHREVTSPTSGQEGLLTCWGAQHRLHIFLHVHEAVLRNQRLWKSDMGCSIPWSRMAL